MPCGVDVSRALRFQAFDHFEQMPGDPLQTNSGRTTLIFRRNLFR